MIPRLTLVCLVAEANPAWVGQRYEIPADRPVVIGRTPPADLVFGDLTVGRRHARIFWDGAAWRVEDVGSPCGTYQNDARLPAEPAALRDCDVLSLGQVRFRVRISATSG